MTYKKYNQAKTTLFNKHEVPDQFHEPFHEYVLDTFGVGGYELPTYGKMYEELEYLVEQLAKPIQNYRKAIETSMICPGPHG